MLLVRSTHAGRRFRVSVGERRRISTGAGFRTVASRTGSEDSPIGASGYRENCATVTPSPARTGTSVPGRFAVQFGTTRATAPCAGSLMSAPVDIRCLQRRISRRRYTWLIRWAEPHSTSRDVAESHRNLRAVVPACATLRVAEAARGLTPSAIEVKVGIAVQPRADLGPRRIEHDRDENSVRFGQCMLPPGESGPRTVLGATGAGVSFVGTSRPVRGGGRTHRAVAQRSSDPAGTGLRAATVEFAGLEGRG